MRCNYFVLVLCLLLGVTPFAQTNNATVGWNQPEANASTFTYTLKVDTAAPITLTPTCATGACSAPFTLATPTATHTYILAATNAFGTTTMTLGPGAPPNTSGFKVTVTVTITQSSDEEEP